MPEKAYGRHSLRAQREDTRFLTPWFEQDDALSRLDGPCAPIRRAPLVGDWLASVSDQYGYGRSQSAWMPSGGTCPKKPKGGTAFGHEGGAGIQALVIGRSHTDH